MKQKTEQKLEKIQKDNLETEKIINEIKDKINTLRETYLYEIYKLLKQIVGIRRKQFPRYSINDLSKEKGIELKYWFLKYLFKLDYASPRSIELMENKIIKPTLVMRVIYQNKEFQNEESQDKIIQDILDEDNEINIYKLSRMNSASISSYMQDVKGVPIKEEFLDRLQTTYQLNYVYNKISKEEIVITNKKNKKEFVDSFNRLQNLVGVKIGIRMVCPNCEHRIKLNEWKKEDLTQ